MEGSGPSYLTAQSSSSSAMTFPKKAKKKKLSMKDLNKGVRVRHPFFGEGVVNDKPQGRSVNVLFQRHGVKTLHLDYAKLSII
jgi:DNA helicase-2/ATP-dependent DNA helicase PcrA